MSILFHARHDETMRPVFAALFTAQFTLHDSPPMLDSIGKGDVVLFNGGTDINPALYGEARSEFTDVPDLERDNFERKLFRRAQAVGAACIGICRGAQFLCAMSGGKLIQHVTGHRDNCHHIVGRPKEGHEIERVMMAFADHHQMMYPYDTFHHLIAWAENIGESHCEYGKEWRDGKEPEIVWFPDTRSLAIQPHPEWMDSKAVFVEYCRELVKQYIFPQNA